MILLAMLTLMASIALNAQTILMFSYSGGEQQAMLTIYADGSASVLRFTNYGETNANDFVAGYPSVQSGNYVIRDASGNGAFAVIPQNMSSLRFRSKTGIEYNYQYDDAATNKILSGLPQQPQQQQSQQNPTYQNTPSSDNSGLVRETCTLCKGSGKVHGTVTTFGLGSKWCEGCQETVSNDHCHHCKVCPSCSGKKYVERRR